MTVPVLQYLVPAAVGSLIGGCTNALAVWMLFHPYETIRVFGLRLPFTPGLVPKNHEKLAERIGNTVSTRLLSSDDLGKALEGEDVRRIVTGKVTEFLDNVLSKPVGESAGKFLEKDPAELADMLCERIGSWIPAAAKDDAVVEQIADLLLDQFDSLRPRKIREIIGDAGMDAVEHYAEETIRRAFSDEGTRERIIGFLEDKAEDFLAGDKPLHDMVGEHAVASLEGRILEGVVERLPAVARKVAESSAVQENLRAAVERLLGRLNIFAQLFGPDADRVIDGINLVIEEEISQLPAFLDKPSNRNMVRGFVRDVLDRQLARSPQQIFAGLSSAQYVRIKQGLVGLLEEFILTEEMADRAVGLVLPHIRRQGETRLEEMLERAGFDERKGEIRARIVAAVRDTLADPRTVDAVVARLRPFLEQRVAAVVPADLISKQSYDWLANRIADQAITTMTDNTSAILKHIDTGKIVRERVLGYPLPKLEKLIRETAGRELRWITVLGFVLGAVVGLINPLLSSLFA